MKMDRSKKAAFVEELAGKLAEAQCVYLTDFTGLDVERITLLRSKLRASSVEYVVVKNTLARRAIAGTAAAVLEPFLEGPTAFAVGRADLVQAARVLTDFSKDTNVPRIKGGVIAGRIVGVEEIRRLASLPGREVLLARLAGSMKSPLSGLVFVLAGVLGKFVRTVEALRVQRAEESPGVPGAAGEGTPAVAEAEGAAATAEAATDAAAPGREEAAPSPDEATPLPAEAAPSPHEAAPSPEETAPSPEEAAPSPDEAAPSPDEVAPSPDEVAPSPDEVAPSPDEAAPSPDSAPPPAD